MDIYIYIYIYLNIHVSMIYILYIERVEREIRDSKEISRYRYIDIYTGPIHI